jgi:cysteinyl-tRNA synthetase
LDWRDRGFSPKQLAQAEPARPPYPRISAVPMPVLTLYNTLTRKKELFVPIEAGAVRMYVCGPTVYDYAHIGNARPIIVFDVLFRLLRHLYGEAHVIYARNITDVDDKINARAAEEGVPIRDVTERTAAQFHSDIKALGVLEPTVEPRATEHIGEMVQLIETLLERGHAYIGDDHVLFDVASMPDYGKFANRDLEEMEAGARVDVAPYKKGPMDFVLWKPSKLGEPSWPSPKGVTAPGRPGWHIECSAMAWKHLGPVFDIHGGGIDLVFPHHQNEIAQSCCAHGKPVMANVWMHNGFLQVQGEKMSKSLGNFITINQLLESKEFGGQQWHGRVLRLAMLGTQYRQPIDWTVDRLAQARATLFDLADLLHGIPAEGEPHEDVIAALADDLNTPSMLSILHGLAKSARRNPDRLGQLKATLEFLGLYGDETVAQLNVGAETAAIDEAKVEQLIQARHAARRAKDYKEADRIRAEIDALGVTLKDEKDRVTGDVKTTWEVKR